MMQTQEKNIESKNGKDVEKEIPIYTCFNSYEFDSFIRGYDVHQHILTSAKGETHRCTRERRNEQDCNAVAVKYENKVVGHISVYLLVFDPSRTILRN